MARRLLWISSLLLFATLATLALAADVPVNLERALAAQEQLTFEEPNNAGAYNDYGNLLVLAARHKAAEAAYRQALTLEPSNVSARFNLALLLQQTGRQREAAQELREVLDYAPGYAWAHYQIGVYHDGKGERSAAIDAYAHAFALDPQLTFPNVNPHIIDNRWVTEALIQAHRYRDEPGAQVPRLYGDPMRIKELMLDEEKSMGAPEVADGMPTEMGMEGAGEGFARRGAVPRNAATLSEGGGLVDETGAAPRASRQLTQDDIDTSSSGGQVIGGVPAGRRTITGPGGVPGQNRGTARVRTRTPTTTRPATPSRSRTRTTSPGEAAPRIITPAVPGRTPPTNRTPTLVAPARPGGPAYRPSRLSNSRLQLELLPSEENDERVASLVPPAGS